jgi:NAD(P)-dependent dehydrogenase (short-subunit alcohol dehydrogenase family)
MESQRALVTGGGRGIGEAVARLLAREGARVLVVSRTRAELDRVASDIGAEAEVCDVTDPEQVEALARRAGDVSILVNNAGLATSSPLVRTDPALWRRILDANLTSAFLMCRAFLPGMLARRAGRVVNVASVAGKRGGPYITAYAAAKHGLLGLTSSLALELRGSGVLVNAVCPGYVDTPMTRDNVAKVARATGRPEADVLRSFLDSAGQAALLPASVVAEAIVELARPGCSRSGEAVDL